LGNGAYGILSDAGKMEDIHLLADKISLITTKVHILFVNAGVGIFNSFENTSEEEFDANININFKGAFFTIQKLLPTLTDNASIILNSTVLVHLGLATSSAYAASKAAILTLSKTLAIELASRNIRVNTISPGPVETPIYEKMGMSEEALQDFAAGVQSKIPLQRFGNSEEIAQTALFLG